MGMGNDPINGIDPDGGYKTWFGAALGWIGGGFKGKIDNPGLGGDKNYAISTITEGFDGDLFTVSRDYGSNFFIEGDVGVSVGPQAGFDVKLGGAKASFSGHYNRTKINIFGGGYSSKKGLYNNSQQQASYNDLTSGYSIGMVLVGGGAEHYPSSGTYIPREYDGQMKSEEISFPIFGTLEKDYDTSGSLLETTKSWGIGSDVKILLLGVHFNLDIGYKDIE
jgi:hypothetical protein